MYIIAGLGNPDGRYENTRHNVGFEVIDILADRMGICADEKKHRALCGRGALEGQKVILLKPQTYIRRNRKILLWYMTISVWSRASYGFGGRAAPEATTESRILSPIWEPRSFHG